MKSRWRFWIDVGGTFTDCIGFSPEGTKHRVKVLSSGKTKGAVCAGSTAAHIVDPAFDSFADNFWNGARLSLLNKDGSLVQQAMVTRFESKSGSFCLDGELSGFAAGQAASPNEAAQNEAAPNEPVSFELDAGQIAPLLAIRSILKLPISDPLPTMSVRLGTTRGTNALLTRTGARTAFLTTKGFGDIPHIGCQDRPRLFELGIRKRKPLFETTVEIDERTAVDGTILSDLNDSEVRVALERLKDSGIQSLGVCLMHAWRFPQHEKRIGEIAAEFDFENVSLSHEVSRLAKFVSRAETTVLDAYLNPVIGRYVAGFREALGPDSKLRLINSAGQLMSAEGVDDSANFTGKDSILSGPAGGVIGFSQTAMAAGHSRSIGFDMGGTSTDVSRFDGRLHYETESLKSNVRIISPVLAIETVAAGGGSICHFDGIRLRVGPASAGADPGPACYGRGGPLTVTDLNLFLGRLIPDQFPFDLSAEPVATRLQEIADEIGSQDGTEYSLTELAEGFLRIANANMASAIRTISVAEGFAASEFTMVAFGGAAPQHACAVADELGIDRILVHPDAGILSAHGIGLCEVSRQEIQGIYRNINQINTDDLQQLVTGLKQSVERQLKAEGVALQLTEWSYSVDLRYEGTEPFLTIDCTDSVEPLAANDDATAFSENLSRRFQTEHQRRYGYTQQRDLEVVSLRVTGGKKRKPNDNSHSAIEEPLQNFVGDRYTGLIHNGLIHNGVSIKAAAINRDSIPLHAKVTQPSLIVDSLSTTFVAPGWELQMLPDRQLLLVRADKPLENKAGERSSDDELSTPDPALLEIFNNHFAGIAKQMGIALQNTSVSVNVKERLDFSCAIFDAQGGLVVNAPHIPVHLGAMGETVKQLIRLRNNSERPLRPGDVLVTNDPFQGGSHLPDVTVVTPVFSPDGSQLRFLLASRAHHAEIGGVAPGSMPPFSRSLAEEGVLISNFLLLEKGQNHFDALESQLTDGLWPSRNPNDNLADIRAQVAANQQGIDSLDRLINRDGWTVVNRYLVFIQDAAGKKCRQAIQRIPPGNYSFEDQLDNGAEIKLAIAVRGGEIDFDFTGTSPVQPNNFNANPAIVSAAIMYCLRCLIGEDIPLNEGVLAPVNIRLPECFLNPPYSEDPQNRPAVVAGNVETSQRIVDTIFGALNTCAASQGTMNNLLFGDNTFGYYETICGGEGATADRDGADAVHTHMTNTRMTDPEVFEQRFPVRLLEFSIRHGSGGDGKHRGGCGVVRRMEFLRELNVAVLSSRRAPFAPYGIDGANPGLPGENTLLEKSGEPRKLNACQQISVRPGDQITIKTPGGGGFGRR